MNLIRSIDALDKPDGYRPAWRAFVRWLGGRELTTAAVAEYFATLKASSLAVSTILSRRTAVRARLRDAALGADAGAREHLEAFLRQLDHDPATRPPRRAATLGAARIIYADEVQRLLAAASSRDGAVIEFLFGTGCRISELCSARWDKVTTAGELASVTIRGKGDKERVLEVPAAVLRRLRSLFDGRVYLFETREHGQFDRVFLAHRVAALGRRVLGRKISPHMLRHGYASVQIARNGMVRALKDQLGHASAQTTLDTYVEQR